MSHFDDNPVLFFLPPVWETFQNTKLLCSPDRVRRNTRKPILLPTKHDWALVEEGLDLIGPLIVPDLLLSHHSTPSVQSSTPQPSHTPSPQVFGPFYPSHESLDLSTIPRNIHQSKPNMGEQKFIRWFNEMINMGRSNFNISTATSTQKFALNDLDGRWPLRDFAPSRIAITRPGGPFTPGAIQTKEGLFSAIIFRGISFGSRFMQEAPNNYTGLFSSHSHYQQFLISTCPTLTTLAGQDAYFCNMQMYGQPSPRSTQQAEINYMVAASDLLSYLQKTDCLSVLQLAEFVAINPAFKFFGKLGGFMLQLTFTMQVDGKI
ncbi:hypothetical protein BT96DRAFT_993656 [Gymnopus androsaceus JB14]|uniref:Uncharacterized protein n=1 Tax=Gymnopus androsaceus JB14 TaxID=1447944 RepID=A0A6A4HR73_9AGAR|nr:hypothetical protein BT96DRAFT_993656 [Gymnopus androsaceus JB14]